MVSLSAGPQALRINNQFCKMTFHVYPNAEWLGIYVAPVTCRGLKGGRELARLPNSCNLTKCMQPNLYACINA